VHPGAVRLPDQVDARDQIAPLVVPARLQGASVAVSQLAEVVRLEEGVGELGEGDPLVAGEPACHRVLREHRPQPEVLPDVSQQVDGGEFSRPVEVVHQARGILALEGQEWLDLRPQPLRPLGDDLLGIEGALPRRPRVTDHPGGAADERDRPVAGALEVAHEDQLDEVAVVQGGRGGVEAAVVGDGSGGECRAQLVDSRGLGDEPTPLQLVDQVRHIILRLAAPRRVPPTAVPRRSRRGTSLVAARRRPSPCPHARTATPPSPQH